MNKVRECKITRYNLYKDEQRLQISNDVQDGHYKIRRWRPQEARRASPDHEQLGSKMFFEYFEYFDFLDILKYFQVHLV